MKKKIFKKKTPIVEIPKPEEMAAPDLTSILELKSAFTTKTITKIKILDKTYALLKPIELVLFNGHILNASHDRALEEIYKQIKEMEKNG